MIRLLQPLDFALGATPADKQIDLQWAGKTQWVYFENLSPCTFELQNEGGQPLGIVKAMSPFVHPLHIRTEKLILHVITTMGADPLSGGLGPGWGPAGTPAVPRGGFAVYFELTEFEPRLSSPMGSIGAGQYLWIDGLSVWRPAAGTPHPYHVASAINEVIIPQDLVAVSHPAAGSTASLTIVAPGTSNQAGIAITGMTAALATAGAASAGQLNAVVVTGSIGGAYTSEPLCIGAVAFAIDRFVYRGQNLIGGNGVAANSAENFTIAFSLAGIANLFQSINVYYHFGA
jgi:hypothetical protein